MRWLAHPLSTRMALLAFGAVALACVVGFSSDSVDGVGGVPPLAMLACFFAFVAMMIARSERHAVALPTVLFVVGGIATAALLTRFGELQEAETLARQHERAGAAIARWQPVVEAIESFELESGRPPASLDETAARTLEKVPFQQHAYLPRGDGEWTFVVRSPSYFHDELLVRASSTRARDDLAKLLDARHRLSRDGWDLYEVIPSGHD